MFFFECWFHIQSDTKTDEIWIIIQSISFSKNCYTDYDSVITVV